MQQQATVTIITQEGPAPPPTYTLSVDTAPITNIPFTVNGVGKTTPWSEDLTEDYYTIVLPPSVMSGQDEYEFKQWMDGSTSPTRTVNLTKSTSLTAYYELITLPPPPPSWREWWDNLAPLQKLIVVSAVGLGTIGLAATLKPKPQPPPILFMEK